MFQNMFVDLRTLHFYHGTDIYHLIMLKGHTDKLIGYAQCIFILKWFILDLTCFSFSSFWLYTHQCPSIYLHLLHKVYLIQKTVILENIYLEKLFF